MIVKNIIVHNIKKEQAKKDMPPPIATLERGNSLLDKENDTVKAFSEKLASTYFDRKSRFSTLFKDEDNVTPRFQEQLDKLLNTSYDFLEYSRVIAIDLKGEMNSERMSTGGYLIVMEYTSTANNDYLFIALLNNKVEYSINDALDLDKFLTLNIDKMAMASVLNLTKYSTSKDNYLTFLKGLREIPDYFIKFMGADKDKKRDIKDQTREWLKAIGTYLKDEGTDDKSREIIIQDLIHTVKDLSNKETILTAETIANIIEPSDPDKFIDYVFDEEKDFQINSEIETLDTTILRYFGIVKYENKAKDFLLKFPSKAVGNSIIIDKDNGTITIKDIDIAKGVDIQYDNQKSAEAKV